MTFIIINVFNEIQYDGTSKTDIIKGDWPN